MSNTEEVGKPIDGLPVFSAARWISMKPLLEAHGETAGDEKAAAAAEALTSADGGSSAGR